MSTKIYTKDKLFFLSAIFLLPIILFGQAKKISTIELTEFTHRNDYLEHFVVKNNQFYIGTPGILYTLNKKGGIVDTLLPYTSLNYRSSIYTFDVLDTKMSYGRNTLYFFNLLIEIVVYENKKKLIVSEHSPSNILDINNFGLSHTIFDSNKSFYTLYLSDKLSKNRTPYPVITKLDTISGINFDDLVFNEKRLKFNLNINYETTFKVDDSIFVFANNLQKNRGQVVFTDTSFSVKRIIDVQKSLNIPLTEKNLIKIISLDTGNCLFVVSLIGKKKDIIASANYKNGKVIKLLTISRPAVSYTEEHKKKVEYTVFSRFKENLYPNHIMYATEQKELFALYYEKNSFFMDRYKLN